MAVNSPAKLTARDFKSDFKSDWCPGCGDFGIINAVQQALAEIAVEPHNIMFFSGVGCSSKSPHYVNAYGVHTLHGRSLPFAAGAALTNPDIKVVVAGGDGDGYGIGAGHFVGAGRRNTNLTYLVYNNGVYGLTKGQASPTLKLGQQTKSLANPNPNDAVNPLAIAICAGYTFVARSYAYDAKHLKKTIIEAINHNGMALVDILQPCPTYNNLTTKEWYAEQVEVNGQPLPKTYYLDEVGYDGVVKDSKNEQEIGEKKAQALQKVQGLEERIPLGVFYKVDTPNFLERVKPNIPLLQRYSSYKMPIADTNGKPVTEITEALAELATNTY